MKNQKPIVLIYGQSAKGEPVNIIGNYAGLHALRHAVNRALATDSKHYLAAVSDNAGGDYLLDVSFVESHKVLEARPVPSAWHESTDHGDTEMLNWLATHNASVQHVGALGFKVQFGSCPDYKTAQGATLREAVANAMNGNTSKLPSLFSVKKAS